jgi:hypothetical protein
MRENEAKASPSKVNKSQLVPISFYVNQNSSVVKRLVNEKSQQQLEQLENRNEPLREYQYFAASDARGEPKASGSSRTSQQSQPLQNQHTPKQ